MATAEELIIRVSADIDGLRRDMHAVKGHVHDVGTETEKTEGRTSKATGFIRNHWKAVAASVMAAGAGIAAGLGGAVKLFADFEQTAVNAASVTGLVGQAYDDALTNIKNVSKELGEKTVFSSSEAANAMYDLASAGFDVANITAEDLVPILDIASGTQSDLTSATEIVTSAISQFGLTTSDSKRVADVYGMTIAATKAQMDGLGLSMSYIGPVAQSLGWDIEETSAALGILYNKGIDASTAGTALRGAMGALMTGTEGMARSLEGMGIKFDEINPSTHSLTEILNKLAEAGMTTEQAFQLFGRESGPAMLALVSSVGEVDALTESLYGAGGAAHDMATKQLDTLKGSLEMMKSSLEGVVLDVGEALAPTIRRAADAITAFTPRIKEITMAFVEWSNNGGFQRIGQRILEIYTRIREFVVSGIGAVSAAIRPATDAVKEFVGGGGLQRIGDVLGVVYTRIREFITNGIAALRTALQPVTDAIKEFVGSGGLQRIGDTVTIIYARLREFIVNGIESLRISLQPVIEAVREFVGNGGLERMGDAVGIVYNYLKNFITNGIEALRTSIRPTIEEIKEFAGEGGFGRLQAAIKIVWDTIFGFHTTLKDTGVYTTLGDILGIVVHNFLLVIDTVAKLIIWVNDLYTSFKTTYDSINSGTTTFRETISNGWNAIRTAISNIVAGILQDIVEGWNKFLNAIGLGNNKILGSITSIGESILGQWTGDMNKMPTVAGNAMSTAATTIRASGDEIARAANSAAQRGIDALAAGFKEMQRIKAHAANVTISAPSVSTSSSRSSDGTGITRQGKNGTGESNVKIRPAKFASGGMVPYTGFHLLHEKEVVIPPKPNWQNLLVKPILNAFASHPGISSGGGVSRMEITIHNYGDLRALEKTLLRSTQAGTRGNMRVI